MLHLRDPPMLLFGVSALRNDWVCCVRACELLVSLKPQNMHIM